MASLRDFRTWANALDERLLGPAGWTPVGMTYSEYRHAQLWAPESPIWVRAGRPMLLGLALVLFVLGGDSAVLSVLGICLAIGALALMIRADRDLRVAARAARRAFEAAQPHTPQINSSRDRRVEGQWSTVPPALHFLRNPSRAATGCGVILSLLGFAQVLRLPNELFGFLVFGTGLVLFVTGVLLHLIKPGYMPSWWPDLSKWL